MNDQMTLADFPLRPKIHEGESLEGYCWRIFAENGHSVFSQISIAIRAVRTSTRARITLAHFLGTTEFAEIYARQHACASAFNFNFESTSNWLSVARSPRFCSECLRQYGFHMRYWDFPFIRACALHGTSLSDRCRSCERRFSWRYLSYGWICICGASIRQELAQSALVASQTFAKIVVSASDAFPSPSIQGATPTLLLGTMAYRISDVYEMLEWTLRLRKSLSETRPYQRGSSGRLIPRPGTRTAPGRWEICQINASPDQIKRRIARLLRRLFRDQHCVFVDFRSNTFLQQLHAVLEAFPRTPDSLTAILVATLCSKLNSYSAQMEAGNYVCFHPRLNETTRNQLCHTFIEWWTRFASEVEVLPREDVLLANGETNTNIGLALINAFISISFLEQSDLLMRPLQRRWHLPPELRGSWCTVAQVGRYMLHLHEKEQAFLMAFAATAVHALNGYGDSRQCP